MYKEEVYDPIVPHLALALELHGATLCQFSISARDIMLMASLIQLTLRKPEFVTSTSDSVEAMRGFVAYVAAELSHLAPVFALALKRNWYS